MSFAQSIKSYLTLNFDRASKENNGTLANHQNRKRTLAPHKSKVGANITNSYLMSHNIEQNFSVVGQEIKETGNSKKVIAQKIKKTFNYESTNELKDRPLYSEVNQALRLDNGGLREQRLAHKRSIVEDGENSLEKQQAKEKLSTQENSSPSIKTEGMKDKVFDNVAFKSREEDPKETRNKMVRDYAQDIIETLKEKDMRSRVNHVLEKHQVSTNLRAKMVDWMIEVICSYKFSDQTFFMAVNVMDAYFKKSSEVFQPSDIHLIGITCMFIASKYEEIYPMRLSILYEKVGHKKISTEEILKKEGEILSALGFSLVSVSSFDFLTNVLFQMELKRELSEELYDYLQRVCIYLSKAILLDYELINQFNACELAACTLFVAFKVLEQADNSFPVSSMVGVVCNILSINEEVLYSCASKILNLAKNFEKIFPTFKNLKRFHPITAPGKSNKAERSAAHANEEVAASC